MAVLSRVALSTVVAPLASLAECPLIRDTTAFTWVMPPGNSPGSKQGQSLGPSLVSCLTGTTGLYWLMSSVLDMAASYALCGF